MKETEEYIALLRLMSAILRERQSSICLSSSQKVKCRKGIIALDKAVEALQVQVYA
jgi:hypothetical protein